jgi:hypothetical protein
MEYANFWLTSKGCMCQCVFGVIKYHSLTHSLTHSLQDYDHGGGGATGAHSDEQDQQHDRSRRSLLNHCMALIHSGCDYNSPIFSSTVLYCTVWCGMVWKGVWYGMVRYGVVW